VSSSKKKKKQKFKQQQDGTNLPEKQVPAAAKKLKELITGKNTIAYLILILVGITAICFFPMLKNGFTNWDDELYVINNALLRGPDLKGIFTQPVVSNYHPLTIISLAINYSISATEPWSYLLLNLVLHLINTILVFKFIHAISDRKTIVAFLTALLFAIHPMHVESVAWISERKDVLYTPFFLLSLLQYWKYLLTEKQKWLWLCFLFFIFSILSKPAAIVLPILLFLLDYWKSRSFNRKQMLEKIPFFLVTTCLHQRSAQQRAAHHQFRRGDDGRRGATPDEWLVADYGDGDRGRGDAASGDRRGGGDDRARRDWRRCSL
jgi:hypothetical protein